MTLTVRAIAFDLDGTLYHGAEAAPGAVEAVRGLSTRYQILYVTNSTVRTRATIALLLAGMGYPGDESRVYSSAASAARYLHQRGFHAVYVVGASALFDEMHAAAVSLCADATVADVLVVGLDGEWRSHNPKLVRLPKTAPIIACNLDDTFPVEEGRRRPGCGSVVREIEALLGRRRDIVVGKPGTYMLELVLRDLGLSPADVLLVGDGETSDIAAAHVAGCPSVLIAPSGAPSSRANAVIAAVTDLPGLMA